jgi:hypothetical protein
VDEGIDGSSLLQALAGGRERYRSAVVGPVTSYGAEVDLGVEEDGEGVREV